MTVCERCGVRPADPSLRRVGVICFKCRLDEVIVGESDEPVRFWYLSFATPDEFLGAAVVEASGLVGAVRRTVALGINPGGEVAGVPVPEGHEDDLPHDRLLTRDEVEAV